MKVSDSLVVSSGVPDADFQAGLEWVKEILQAFEARDPDFVRKFYADSPTTSFQIDGTEPRIVGFDNIRAAYNWQFDGTVKTEWLLKNVTVIPTQTFWDIRGSVLGAKSDSPVTVDLNMISDKAPQDAQMTALKICRDGDKWLEIVKTGEGTSGPFS